MATLDIGIDLGTSTILAGNTRKGIIVREPSVAAIDKRTGDVLRIGGEVYNMIGRTPPHIRVIRPMEYGVISNYKVTGMLINHVLKKISRSHIFRPRVIVCVPSAVTGVEAQSVIDATVQAGARQVFLIEEPVAAAIGAELDIFKPNGNLIVDIGGGTSDVAVLSMGGIVSKSSLKVAGQEFDRAIIRYMKARYNLMVGEKTAEEIKIKVGTVWKDGDERVMEAKGRDLVSGLPKKLRLTGRELRPCLTETALQICTAIQGVLEKTPPELVGDIRTNGLIMTGGGAMLDGLDRLLEKQINVAASLAKDPVECVARGTAKGFSHLETLVNGIVHSSTHSH